MIPTLLALFACKNEPPPVVDPPPAAREACDAGDQAWVQRVIPLMWGRKPHGSAEVRAWSAMVEQHGREAVLTAMADQPEYLLWWRQWITDSLAVARTGDKAYAQCFAGPLRPEHDGSLTQYMRGVEEPWDAQSPEGGPFNMADVILDGLAADDLAMIWQANLYARMNRPVQGANVSFSELEYNRRVNFGEGFFETYLNRNLDCVICHNSSFSVTDSDDARFDRTWQLPGHHETALLGSNTTFSKDEAFAIFRTAGVADSGVRRPFGMVNDCGRFRRPDRIDGPDFIGQDSTRFIDRYGADGSVWQLERNLDEGIARLVDRGLVVESGGRVDGRESFAYLLGARITDLVFEEATGGRLTIAHGFARNLDQASRLERLTDGFVESGFSLRELLIEITADELFNAALPESCDAPTYGLDPVVNPWTVEDDDPDQRRNGAGDLVHRHSPRVIVNAANDHLGWPALRAWELNENEEEFQASIGIFLRESQPGFSGTDFQGLLALHDRYATCERPGSPDWIDQMAASATAEHTAEDLVFSLKDRLLANGAIAPEERPLLEALIGPLTAPANEVEPAALRAICGALVTSPSYMLVLAPDGIGDAPPIADTTPTECSMAITAMEAAGFADSTCP